MKVVRKSTDKSRYKSETKLIKYLLNHYYFIVFRNQKWRGLATKGTPQHLYLRVIIIYTNTTATLFLRYQILGDRKEPLSIVYYYLPHLIEACALAVGLWENRCKSAASPISTGPFKLIHGHSSFLDYENQRNWKVDLYAWFLGFYPSL